MTRRLLIVLFAVLPVPALAAPLTWTFTGAVTSSDALLHDFDGVDPFPIGAPASYTLTLDPEWFGDWSVCSWRGAIGCDLRNNERGQRLNFSASIAGHAAQYSLNPLHGDWDAATRHLRLDTTLSGSAVVGDPVQGATLTWYPFALDVDLHLPLVGGAAHPEDAFTYYLDFTPTMGSQASTGYVYGRFLSVDTPVAPAGGAPAPTAVPEPAALGLLALGLAAFLRRIR